MITALVILTALVAFLIALVSPNHGTRVQQGAHRMQGFVHRKADTKPPIIRWFLNGASSLAHRLIHHSAAAGKKSRWKLPF